MDLFEQRQAELRAHPRTWLVTGVAGFIGSNLLEALLKLDQRVIGLDNFATGFQHNLDDVQHGVTAEQWARFEFREGDIRDPQACRDACQTVDVVLQQAALGSVPRSIANPVASHDTNVTGFLNMLCGAREAGVRRFVYASSSSVYGDHPDVLRCEHATGRPLSPYAAGKHANELYASAFAQVHGMQCVGLRYFNVFGPRQDAQGAYSAVIPRWAAAMMRGQPVYINGDGETSRDFCFVGNVVRANLLAATAPEVDPKGEILNIGAGGRTTLNQLFHTMRQVLRVHVEPVYRGFREGDVRHSLAEISRARDILGYAPSHDFEAGLEVAMAWYSRKAA